MSATVGDFLHFSQLEEIWAELEGTLNIKERMQHTQHLGLKGNQSKGGRKRELQTTTELFGNLAAIDGMHK